MAEPLASIVVDTDEPETIDVNPDGMQQLLPDGSLVIDISSRREQSSNKKFDRNLALDMGTGELSQIAQQLLEGIEADIQSRSEWESTRSRGIDMLGLKLEEPRGDVGSSSAPLEGMSTVRDSAMLEAILHFQSNAIGELLPAEGPVKVKNVGQETTQSDDLAEAFEKQFNHYLTDIATEYYPDTKRMLFWTGFGGSGWKKVYSCPIRRRPVAESVDAEDFIVSNRATDLWNAARLTHRINMRPSIMKRMQAIGVYRDVVLGQPTPVTNKVEEKTSAIEGIRLQNDRPEDQPYTLYECYCELDLDEYAPTQFKGKAIPLPYRVTVDKDSREILEIHRNWREDDEACLPRKYFVRYPFIEGMGLYGLGLVHVLGNMAAALTGAMREILDAGMFASFPGFLVLKSATRQLTNEMRIPPGGSMALDAPNGRIADVAMPLPYKDASPGLMNLRAALQEDARRLGGTADMPIGEGKQDAPVGTTLALIEQATKVESAIHKGLHHAQAEEFQLLKERFREDPEAFWRHDPQSRTQWTTERMLAALENCDLIPVADPNTPSHVHRLSKALAIKQLQAANPAIYDAVAVDKRVLAMIKVDDVDSLFAPPPTNVPPDPKQIEAQARLMDAQAKAQKVQIDAANTQAEFADNEAERQSRQDIETLKLAQAMVVHSADAQRADRAQVQAEADAAHSRAMDLHGIMYPPTKNTTES